MDTFRTVRSFPPAVRFLLVNQLGIDIGTFLLFPFLAGHLTGDLDMSSATVGVVLATIQLSHQGLVVVGGTASDRFGGHRVIPIGCLMRLSGFALFALVDGVRAVLVASVLTGVAGALLYPAMRACAAQAAPPDRRAEVFAMLNVFTATGGLMGLAVGSVLCMIDFRATAVTAAAVLMVMTMIQLFALPALATLDWANRRCHSRSAVHGWLFILRDRNFLAFSLTMTALTALENQIYLLFVSASQQVSGQLAAAAVMPMVGAVASLALQLRVTRLVRARGGPAAWIAPGLALMGLAFVPPLLTVSSGHPATGGRTDTVLLLVPLAVGAFLLALGQMAAQPSYLELVTRHSVGGLVGTYFGFFYVISGIAASACTSAVGWAMDVGERTGRLWLPWSCCAVLGLISAAGVIWIRHLGRLPGENDNPAPRKERTRAGVPPPRRRQGKREHAKRRTGSSQRARR
ncbi:MFS transporter [Streptomyces abyssomicinicus]|uniref:MFS transporter n=1 Tax=Streptomyces abyssomicinicus TaxID=574929 RepID=UPI00124F7BE0|nr:MFS transporter [Streptomyces abyssomicinicus]